MLDEYERALWTRSPLRVQDSIGDRLPFDVPRWLQDPDRADETLLARCIGPTLDIGCGPGRLVTALAVRGIPALGVDPAAAAVALARCSGALVLRRSVFDRLPGAGRWRVALLADGNIGIGGDPGRLLGRIRELLAPGGHALVEVDLAETEQRVLAGIVDRGGRVTATFPWARLGASALLRHATARGFAPTERWQCSGRAFVSLQQI